MIHELFWLIPLFACTALIYSSVGFGGGSTYLALLYHAGIEFHSLAITALMCNIVVVSGNTFNHALRRNIEPKIVIPFLVSSIPFSFLGGLIPIGKDLFLWVLGISLFSAATRLFFTEKLSADNMTPSWKSSLVIGFPTGAILGLISGVTGIGGGIFLAPVLYLLRWGTPKQIAASASLFILLNSISGLTGQVLKNNPLPEIKFIAPLVMAVFIGGMVGSQLTYIKLNRLALQRVTAILILFVSIRILWDKLF